MSRSQYQMRRQGPCQSTRRDEGNRHHRPEIRKADRPLSGRLVQQLALHVGLPMRLRQRGPGTQEQPAGGPVSQLRLPEVRPAGGKEQDTPWTCRGARVSRRATSARSRRSLITLTAGRSSLGRSVQSIHYARNAGRTASSRQQPAWTTSNRGRYAATGSTIDLTFSLCAMSATI